MEARFSDDDKQDHAISRNGNGIETTEWDGDPGMLRFKIRDASKKEDFRLENALVDGWHDGRKQMTLEERTISCENRKEKCVHFSLDTIQFRITSERCPT